MVSPSKQKSVHSKVIARSSSRKSSQSSRNTVYKPLAGIKFYLHLTGFRKLNEITADILHLGGEIDEFLSKEVTYVITTTAAINTNTARPSDASNTTEHSTSPTTLLNTLPQPSGGSSDSVSQVFSPGIISQTYSPGGGVQVFSPLLSQASPSSGVLSPLLSGPGGVLNSQHCAGADPRRRLTSRAASLLERARFKRPGCSDVISNAKRWNIRVWTVTKLQGYLKDLSTNPLYRHRSSSSTSSVSRSTSEYHRPTPVPASALSGARAQSRGLAAAQLAIAITSRQAIPSYINKTINGSLKNHYSTTPVSTTTTVTPKVRYGSLAPANGAPSSSRRYGHYSASTSEKSSSSRSKPYIKLEDFGKKYRPLFKEITNWPVLNLECSRTTCPFAEQLPSLPPPSSLKQDNNKANNNTPVRAADDKEALNKSAVSQATPSNKRTRKDTPIPDKAGKSRSRRNSGGYCELCCVAYTSLRLHLPSNNHHTFVNTASNYTDIDTLIDGIAPVATDQAAGGIQDNTPAYRPTHLLRCDTAASPGHPQQP